MDMAKYNTLKVDYMQLALKAVSYFILNFEDIIENKGRYLFDLRIYIDEKPLILTAIYNLMPCKAKNSFSFEVVSEDVDLNISFSGSYDVACSCAADIVAEYIRRVKK